MYQIRLLLGLGEGFGRLGRDWHENCQNRLPDNPRSASVHTDHNPVQVLGPQNLLVRYYHTLPNLFLSSVAHQNYCTMVVIDIVAVAVAVVESQAVAESLQPPEAFYT